MDKGTPGSWMVRWHSRMRGAWLREADDTAVEDVGAVKRAFHKLMQDGAKQCTLVLSHRST